MFLAVRGNCDFGSALPPAGDFTAEGVKIFLHPRPPVWGEIRPVHLCLRRSGTGSAGWPCTGHTHNALTDYEDGLYIMNPGSLNGWEATYGTLDITPQGIVTNIVKLP